MADTTTRTLLLNFKSDTKSILDLGVLFAKVEEQAKGMLSEQEQALNKLIAKTDALAKAKEKSNKEQAKLDAQEAKAAKEREAIANREFSLVERRLAQTKALEDKRNKEALDIAGNQGKAQLNAQASYAKQRIKDEEDLANKTRQITLNSLKQTIEERNNILNAASKQRLGNAIGDITSAESSDRKKLLASLRQDMTERAKLQQEEFNLVERGLQQTRTREAERAKIEETAARQRLERQAATNRQLLANETDFNERQRQNQLRGMRSSATAAFSEPTTGRPLAPIPPIPQETRSSYDSLFARIGAINLEYRIWNTLINTVSESLRGVPRVGIELDSVKASLEATMGSTAGMGAALKALDGEAQRTGINIGILRDNFKGFQASTSLAGASMESTWKMFTDMNTVISGLHLSADKANHVFLAMSQIFNKSKVQSEELVKQLGNLLPGAFASFAASMNILPAELSKRMKEGTVYAQDTMENFIAYMANRFTPAFAASADNLNANVGRMQSSFIHLQEAIYESSSGPMNDFVKGATSLTNHITALINGTEQLSSTFTTGLKVATGLLVLELGSLIIKIGEASAAVKVLEAACTFFGPVRIAIVAAAGALAYFATEATAGSEALNKANESYREMKRLRGEALQEKVTTESQLLKITVETDEKVAKSTKLLAQHQEEYNKALQASDKDVSVNGMRLITKQETLKNIQKTIDDDNKAIIQAKKEAEAKILKADEESLARQKEAATRDMTERSEHYVAMLGRYAKTAEEAGNYAAEQVANAKFKADKAAYEKTKERFNAPVSLDRTVENLRPTKEQFDEAVKTLGVMDEELARARQNAMDAFNKKGESASKKAAAAQLKATKEEISVVQEYQKTAANDAKNQIDILNADNKAKILSFEEYAKRKQEILDKDYKAEKDFYEKQKALAEQSGKKGLVADASEKLKRLEQDYQAKSATSQADTSKNIEDYNTNLANIHSKYLDILGVENDSNEQTKVKNAELRKQIVAETTIAGIVGETAKARLKEFDAVENNLKVQAKFKDYQENMKVAQDKFGESVARINVLKNVGAINDFTAAQKMKAANLEAISDREKEISLMEDKLKLEQESGSPVAKSTQEAIRKARAELENFKLEADTVGQYFENTLGSAFESSFQGLITGSMNASQAFKSFATSIVSDIAKIIAQEARSAILRPILAAGFNALGGLFSSGPSVAAGNSESFSSAMQGSNWMTAKVANGGVFSGAGISAHSGTIVNSPTVFPFAKGVGLMGEAGPEAILPLKRNSQGKLGVSVDNTGQERGSNIYYINTTVNAGSNATPDSIANKASEAIIRAIAKQEINSAARPGNRLNQITKYGY